MSGSFFGGLALTTDGSTLTGALGAADPRVAPGSNTQPGTVYGAKCWSGSNQYGMAGATPSSTIALSAGNLYCRPIRQASRILASGIKVDVTTAASAGKRLNLVLYANNTSGKPGVVIWYGLATVDALGTITTSFSAGTIVDSAYFSSNSLSLASGQQVWIGVWAEAAVTLRGMACPFAWLSGASNANSATTTASWATTPSDSPTLTLDNATSPLTTLLEA